MKKILFSIFIFCSLFAQAQFQKPAGVTPVPTYSFFKNRADSTVTIYMGSTDLWNTLLSKFDSVKTKGYATNFKLLSYKRINDTINYKIGYATLWRLTHKLDSILGLAKLRNDSVNLSGYFSNWKALQYRKLNNHDSLSTLDEKAYASLTGKPDLTIYRQLNNHDSLSTLDEKAYSSLTGKPDLTVYRLNNDHDSLSTLQEKSYNSLTDKPTIPNGALYRLLNNHDSLSTLDEKAYASLTGKPDLTVYKLGNDSVNRPGFYTNYKAQIASYLANDTWTKVYDYAGNLSNFYKLSKDNTIIFAFPVEIGQLYSVADAGKQTIANMPLVRSASGDTLQYSIGFAGSQPFKFRTLANGTGGFTDARIIVEGKLQQKTGAVNGYYLRTDGTGLGSWSAITGLGVYRGTWDATTSIPAGTYVAGDWFRVVVASSPYAVGDDNYYNGSTWQRVPSAGYTLQAASASVLGGIKTGNGFTMTGDVASVKTDYVENASHTGDATGATALTLATVNSNVGTYTKVTINAKGLATSGSAATTSDIAEGTNLYYTEARVAANSAVTANTAKVTNANHSGDATGATALTLATVNSNVGTYQGLTVNAKGLVTAAANQSYLVATDIAGKKDKSDSTATDGYTRRDRFAAGLATKQPLATTLTNITDSLLARYTKTQSDGRFQPKATVLTNIQDSLNIHKDKNDSIRNAGFFTNFKAASKMGTLINDQWMTALDYAGNPVNLFKISKDNMFTIAPRVNLNAFNFVLNPGFNYFADIPLSAAGASMYHGTGIRINGVDVLKARIYGLADSARIIVPRIQMTDSAGVNKIIMGRSDGLMRWSDTKYLFTLSPYRLLVATAANQMGQLVEGTTGKLLMGSTGTVPIWTTPTYPNSATNGKVLIGDGTNVVLSTPTFPNASATFGKIIKSDGTNWVASTETYAIPGTSGNGMISNGTNWTSAAIPDIYWTGTETNLVAATGRTSLGGTTVGQSMFTLTNPSSITFPRFNADNTASALSASDFRTAIGAGTSSTVGTVTSVAMTTPTGLSVSGSPITSSGTLGLTLTSGYVIPTTTNISHAETAYGWGNHASAGYATGTIYDATLTAAVSGSGLSISATPTFTANASANKTITITSNATVTNTEGTIVLRGASGYVNLLGTFCSSSDSTLKRNIRSFSKYDFQRASKVDLLKFNYKADAANKDNFGGMAQDIQKLIPEVVSTNPATEKLTVDYIQLLIILSAQQKEEIQLLKEQKIQLEKRIEKLENHNKWEAKQINF